MNIASLSVFLISYRDRWNAMWLLCLGAMQWVDAYIWFIHDNGEDLFSCSYNNHLATFLGVGTIVLEPIVNGIACFYQSGRRLPWHLSVIYAACFAVAPQLGKRLFSGDPHCTNEWISYVCATITDGVHVLYNVGMDSYGGFKCWSEHYFFGEPQAEIPLIVRIAFLIGIIYPYRYSVPLAPGIINVLIITASWFIGYYSDAHASVWCCAASFQSLYFVLFDAWLFPTGYDPKATQFEYHATKSKEGKMVKKGELKVLQRRYTRGNALSTEWDAIVIGSGIGGLSTAALMARAGKKVLVLEQHYRAGGCMHTFDEFGGEFDSGIHYVGAMDKVKLLLSFITSKAVEWYQMGSAPRSDGVYDKIDLDGTDKEEDVVKYRAGMKVLKKELIDKFPAQKQQIERYLQFSQSTAGRITDIFVISKIFPNCFLFDENGLIYRSYIGPLMRWMFKTANEVLDEFVDDPKLKAILGGGQLIDWCLVPSKASWWVVAAMMNYYRDGGFYPKGGSNNIPMSIIPVINENGGSVLCRAKVKQILVNNKTNTAYGVEMEKTGDIIKAPLIISGVGAHTLFHELLPDDIPATKQQIEELSILETKKELEPSYGHMTAFITFDGTAEDLELPDYNIHSWGNLKKYGYDISKIQQLFYDDPIKYGDEANITLTFPSAKDPFYCIKFPNKSNALLLCEAKWEWFESFKENGSPNEYGKRTAEYKEFKEKFKAIFMRRLLKYCPKVEGKIIDFEIGSPLSSEHFLNTYKGGS